MEKACRGLTLLMKLQMMIIIIVVVVMMMMMMMMTTTTTVVVVIIIRIIRKRILEHFPISFDTMCAAVLMSIESIPRNTTC
jgi:hypothetical protein